MTFVLSAQNVFKYLIDNGLCTKEEQSTSQIELKSANNFNLLISLPGGRQLLVKQERTNSQGKRTGEFFKEWKIQTLLQLFPALSHFRPCLSEAIHFNAEHAIIVFNYFNDYLDLEEFYFKENIFPPEIATKIGATLASIHRLTLDNQEYREVLESGIGVSSNQALDIAQDLERLTPAIFDGFPVDALKFFVLYQRFDSLRQVLAQLKSVFTPCCLTHNDLKLNNILLSNSWKTEVAQKPPLANDSMIRLIDWEKSSWGDPAYDLGMLITSYLRIWLSSLITSKTIAIEESLRLATTPLEFIQPSITALVQAYFSSFPEILEHRPDFLQQVLQFSGLAFIQAIVGVLMHQKTFGNLSICMLQIAKMLLCRPEESIKTVFGTTALELTHRQTIHLLK